MDPVLISGVLVCKIAFARKLLNFIYLYDDDNLKQANESGPPLSRIVKLNNKQINLTTARLCFTCYNRILSALFLCDFKIWYLRPFLCTMSIWKRKQVHRTFVCNDKWGLEDSATTPFAIITDEEEEEAEVGGASRITTGSRNYRSSRCSPSSNTMAAVRSLLVSVKSDSGSDRSDSDSESESDRDVRDAEPMEVEEGELESEDISVNRSLKELLPVSAPTKASWDPGLAVPCQRGFREVAFSSPGLPGYCYLILACTTLSVTSRDSWIVCLPRSLVAHRYGVFVIISPDCSQKPGSRKSIHQ